MGRKPRRRLSNANAQMEVVIDAEAMKMAIEHTATELAGEPAVGHSLEYDVKKGKVVARPIYPGEIFKKPEKPLPKWKLHLAIFLVGLAIGVLIALSIVTSARGGDLPPRIGRLTMPAPWWEISQDAAREHGLDPYWIAAVMAIESRFERFAINKRHRCYGLMQLQKDVAQGLGVTDPFDAEQNIRGGARILGRLEKRYGGDKKRILKKYNPTDTGAYSREVMRAWRQAKKPKE